MKVVFDTNILFSAIGWRGKPYECVQLARRGGCRSVTCIEILAELEEKLIAKRHFAPAKAAETITEIRLFSENVRIEGKLRAVSTDPDDDKFIECALTAKAPWIVSGDHHLLDLGSFQGVAVTSAAEF